MNQDLIILTSPPATGKTYWIESFIDGYREEVLVISPLRVLADECKREWGKKAWVMTPEEWLGHPCLASVVIFDEFHLNFYWGDTFRPAMWEAFYEVVQKAKLIILLTATLNPMIQAEITGFSTQFDSIQWLDFGNQKLKNVPYYYLKLPSLSWVQDVLEFHPPIKGVTLIFCATRKEVFKWENSLNKRGCSVWSCVGGESAAFSLKVATQAPPQFIVATTVLSHGVNLPQVSRLIFTYELKNLDFWVQMVARGGRRGERFEVFALDTPNGLKWNKLTNFLAILSLSFRMSKHLAFRQIEQWFLKV